MTYAAVPSQMFAERRARQREIRDKPLRFPDLRTQEQAITGPIRQPSFPASAKPGEFGREERAAGYGFLCSRVTRRRFEPATRGDTGRNSLRTGNFSQFIREFLLGQNMTSSDLFGTIFPSRSAHFRLAMLAL
jgi:hypothetical protein